MGGGGGALLSSFQVSGLDQSSLQGKTPTSIALTV